MLAQVVLPLERLPAHFAGVGELGALVSALMDHEVVALGEAALAVLADKLALGAHLPTEVPRPVLVLYLHDGEHIGGSRVAMARLYLRMLLSLSALSRRMRASPVIPSRWKSAAASC